MSPSTIELTPRRVHFYSRRLRAAWDEPGMTAFNISRECSDLLSREELLDEAEI